MKTILAVIVSMVFSAASSSALSQEEIATVRSIKATLADEPKNPSILSALGLAYLKNQQFQQAIPPLKQSLTIKKDDFKTHFFLALAFWHSPMVRWVVMPRN